MRAMKSCGLFPIRLALNPWNGSFFVALRLTEPLERVLGFQNIPSAPSFPVSKHLAAFGISSMNQTFHMRTPIRTSSGQSYSAQRHREGPSFRPATAIWRHQMALTWSSASRMVKV